MDGLIDGLHGEEIHERLSRKKFMPVQILTDVTVIECATFVTGPYATALLADLGARVIKIESPPAGDPTKRRNPARSDGGQTSTCPIPLRQ